ncbi:hypothetical protein [Aquipuribacter sp. SD81]|uniref:hypothetical protein n=1 Tax=Aquipuribacter sp. SD81 TaxID=3127703 RepID=UPI00301727BC
MSMLPEFILPNRSVPRPTLEVPEVSGTERRWRRRGLVALGAVALVIGAAVALVVSGVLPLGPVATALAVLGLGCAAAAAVVDVGVSLRVPRRDEGVRPGLRAASYLWLATLVCVVATFAFLAT